MKKFLKITIVFVILLFCAVSVVNAATNDELVKYVSKNFNIAGKSVNIGAENKRKVERYLNAHPVTNEQADQIIAKVDEAVKLMNDAGVSNPAKLNKDQKEKLVSIAKDAASIAGATISYDSKNETVTVYYNGAVFDTVSVNSQKGLVQTGNDYSFVVYGIAGVAVIAVATLVIRKKKVNA